MLARDQRDRRYPQRLAGSYVVSLVLHALAALLLFSVTTSSSQQGATQSIAGGEIVTVTQRTVAHAQPTTAPRALPPPPHVPVIAPVKHAMPRIAAQRQPAQRHELAKIVPNAPPNPRPVPQATTAPNPQPTQPVMEPSPAPNFPAAPISIPTASAVAVTIKVPPTVAPSPVPTVKPTIAPTATPQPTAAPTPVPATPAPVVAVTATPSPKPLPQVQATVAPVKTAAPAAPLPSPAPAKTAGVPSPSPTMGAAPTKQQGVAPSPAPKDISSPGPRPGEAAVPQKAAPERPVSVQATASPSPAPKQSAANQQLNNKLRNLLPTGPVRVSHYQMAPGYQSVNTNLEPSPPPEILARTKYLFESTGSGRTKMWVTDVHHNGPLTTCTGWLVRWPEAPTMSAPSAPDAGPANGSQITVGGGHPHGVLGPGMTGIPPIIEGVVTYMCSTAKLTPFSPSPAP